MSEHQFTYYGEVRGQARPRFSKFGAYKPKKDKDYEQAIRDAYINSGGKNYGKSPIVLRIDIYREIPKSRPRYLRYEMDTFKPDATNVAKSVEDALNGIAYDDDKQIVSVTVCKHQRRRLPEHMDIYVKALVPTA